ncbi:sensor histidine kinase [Streptomyces sp. NPDC056347]|uniref:sensor histidine kinase n=1 Tax=Streptomyces sp. NPDC056347 TaxID=3345790 RepID=UPI0035DB00E9
MGRRSATGRVHEDGHEGEADGIHGEGADGVGRTARKTSPLPDLPAPRLARTILEVVLLGYMSITLINLAGMPHTDLSLGTSVLALILIYLLQRHHSSAHVHLAPGRQKALTLGAQAVLTYLPLALFGSQWGAMAGFLAGSLLLLLPPRAAWPAYGLVGVSMLLPPLLDRFPLQESFYLSLSTLLTGLVVFGLSRLSSLIHALHDTRLELSRLAVTQERLRFARDLHDLLGYSLSAITLKSELIHRLVPTNPRRAMDEVSELLEISRQSLADVRAVASGLRAMSLKQELGSARSLLEAADVRVETDVRMGTIDQQVDTVLAAVLREAVTNLLRHTRATSCRMEAVQENDLVRLSMTNDGVDPAYRDTSPHSGSGLGNLAVRLRAVSGTLDVERRPDGTFQLVAQAPARLLRPLPDLDDDTYAEDSVA